MTLTNPDQPRLSPDAAALGLGAVAGMRAALALALLAGRVAPRPVASALTLAAALELLGDKLPQTPDRTEPGSLSGRVVSGALCGAVLWGRRGALLGAAGAFAAAHALYHARREAGRALGVPDLPLALLEDALALALGRTALSGVGRGPAQVGES